LNHASATKPFSDATSRKRFSCTTAASYKPAITASTGVIELYGFPSGFAAADVASARTSFG
jgi:hypothetical protein